MTNDLENILFQLRELEARDFDYAMSAANGLERLNEICSAIEKLPRPSSAFAAMFELMERLSESELGTPGPLVHTMESHGGAYEAMLEESVKRKPVDLSVWMVNRILNAECDRTRWMSLLQLAAEHTKASEVVRDQSKHFIKFQNAKSKQA